VIKEFIPVTQEIPVLIDVWEPTLRALSDRILSERRNSQQRTIRQIVGHMVDSASNNTHRIVHLQYQESPFVFPNYATFGNNDRWIAIQNYQEEDWNNLVSLWKFIHLHFIHTVKQIREDRLDQEWIAGEGKTVSLRDMVTDFLRHFKLHLDEIADLMKH